MTFENDAYRKSSASLELAKLMNERMTIIEGQMDHLIEISKILHEDKSNEAILNVISELEKRIEKLEDNSQISRNNISNIIYTLRSGFKI